jgi:hypothetical protein
LLHSEVHAGHFGSNRTSRSFHSGIREFSLGSSSWLWSDACPFNDPAALNSAAALTLYDPAALLNALIG